MEQWPGRRPDQSPEAPEAADVWPSRLRLAPPTIPPGRMRWDNGRTQASAVAVRANGAEKRFRASIAPGIARGCRDRDVSAPLSASTDTDHLNRGRTRKRG